MAKRRRISLPARPTWVRRIEQPESFLGLQKMLRDVLREQGHQGRHDSHALLTAEEIGFQRQGKTVVFFWADKKAKKSATSNLTFQQGDSLVRWAEAESKEQKQLIRRRRRTDWGNPISKAWTRPERRHKSVRKRNPDRLGLNALSRDVCLTPEQFALRDWIECSRKDADISAA